MGGELAGGHLPEEESKTWDSAISTFLSRNYSIPELASEDFDPRSILPNEPLFDASELSYNEQLDFGIRQPHYIRRLCSFARREGYACVIAVESEETDRCDIRNPSLHACYGG